MGGCSVALEFPKDVRRKRDIGNEILAMISVPGGNVLAAICCSRTLGDYHSSRFSGLCAAIARLRRRAPTGKCSLHISRWTHPHRAEIGITKLGARALATHALPSGQREILLIRPPKGHPAGLAEPCVVRDRHARRKRACIGAGVKRRCGTAEKRD